MFVEEIVVEEIHRGLVEWLREGESGADRRKLENSYKSFKRQRAQQKEGTNCFFVFPFF